jgi:hypothetical protein
VCSHLMVYWFCRSHRSPIPLCQGVDAFEGPRNSGTHSPTRMARRLNPEVTAPTQMENYGVGDTVIATQRRDSLNEMQNIISQLENQREVIDRALTALREITGIGAPAATTEKRGRPPQKKQGGKRHMSAEGRARIAESTRRRWAEKRAADAAVSKKPKK